MAEAYLKENGGPIMLSLYEIKPKIWAVVYQRNAHSEIKTLFVGRYRRAWRCHAKLIEEWG
jgi:hypothetical protein